MSLKMPMSHPPLRRVLLAVVISLSAAACGTTVSTAGQAHGAGGGSGLSVPGGITASNGGAGQVPGAGSAAGGYGPGSAPGATGANGAAGTSGGAAGAGYTPSGSTAGGARPPVKVGFMLIDFSKVAASFGFSGSADVFQGFKEMVAYLNKHGGLAGRQIKPDYYSIDGSSSDANTAYQQACTHFTQDAHVDVVISDGNYHPTFEACMAQAHITHFDVSTYAFDTTGQRQNPIYLTPTAFGVDRYSSALLETAVSSHMVSSGQLIGYLIEGCPANLRAYSEAAVPTAKQYGLKTESEQTVCNNGTGDLGTEESQIQSAVLKFRQDGVTSVAFISFNEGFIAGLFAQGAEQQKWRPQYLLTSVALPERGVESQGSALSVPTAQLPQMKGMGWTPISDVGKPPAGSAAQQAELKLCKQMSPSQAGAANAPDPGVRRDFLGHFYRECDMLLLVRQIMTVNGASLALPAVMSAYAKAVDSLTSAADLNGVYHLTGSRTDGVFVAAPFAYDNSCKCMAYTGPPRSFR